MKNIDCGILNQPLLYLSSYFEKNKGLYYDNLTFVRTKNDMKQWIKYFLVGIIDTVDSVTNTLSNVMNLKVTLEEKLHLQFGKKANNALIVLQQLFKRPVIHVNQVKEMLDSSYKTANDLVEDFVNANILIEMTGQSRNRVFVFEKYIKLF